MTTIHLMTFSKSGIGEWDGHIAGLPSIPSITNTTFSDKMAWPHISLDSGRYSENRDAVPYPMIMAVYTARSCKEIGDLYDARSRSIISIEMGMVRRSAIELPGSSRQALNMPDLVALMTGDLRNSTSTPELRRKNLTAER